MAYTLDGPTPCRQRQSGRGRFLGWRRGGIPSLGRRPPPRSGPAGVCPLLLNAGRRLGQDRVLHFNGRGTFSPLGSSRARTCAPEARRLSWERPPAPWARESSPESLAKRAPEEHPLHAVFCVEPSWDAPAAKLRFPPKPNGENPVTWLFLHRPFRWRRLWAVYALPRCA